MKYYGGWSLFELYCLPIGLRNFYFEMLANHKRKEAEEAARRKRKQIIEISIVTFFLVLGLTIMAAFVLLLMHSQGKL